MANLEVPFSVVATFVGSKPAGERERDGQHFTWGAKPQFVVDQPDGSAGIWDVRGDDLDRLKPAFDWQLLSVGDKVRLTGTAVCVGPQSRSGSFLQVAAAQLVVTEAASSSKSSDGVKPNGRAQLAGV